MPIEPQTGLLWGILGAQELSFDEVFAPKKVAVRYRLLRHEKDKMQDEMVAYTRFDKTGTLIFRLRANLPSGN